jgi:hypothetical protein
VGLKHIEVCVNIKILKITKLNKKSDNIMATVFFGAGASKYFGIPTMKEFPEDQKILRIT